MKIFLTALSFFVFKQILSQPTNAYPDNSPNLEDFLSMGVPSYDSPWSYQDYQKAIEIFDQIYEADKFSLPRFESDFSGKLFERMIHFGNFNFLTNKSINIGKRIILFEKLKAIPARLAIYYVEDNNDFERFGAELLECYLLDAQVLSQGLKLYNEMRLQLGERANSGSFKSGFEALNLEYINSIERLLQIFEKNSQRYDEKVLENFSKKLFFFVSGLENDEIKKQLRVRIKLLDKSEMTVSVRSIFQELKHVL